MKTVWNLEQEGKRPSVCMTLKSVTSMVVVEKRMLW